MLGSSSGRNLPLMAEAAQGTCPMMRPSACLQSDQARLLSRHEDTHATPADFLAKHRSPLASTRYARTLFLVRSMPIGAAGALGKSAIGLLRHLG